MVLVAIGTHFLLPPYLENRVEERLEEHGGRAEVELSAVPAIRLLAGHGDRIEVTGSGLEVDFEDPDEDAFDQLNKFDEVEIELTDVEADPFDVSSFRLEGLGDGRYRIETDATASVQELGRVAGEQFGPLGGLIGSIVGGSAPLSARRCRSGSTASSRPRTAMSRWCPATQAWPGLPAGPVARLVTNAILSAL